jgi:hypothetical protein
MAAQDLCDLAYVKTRLELGADETDRDDLFSQLITPASEAIKGEVNRELVPETDNETRTIRVDPKLRLDEGEILCSLSPYDLRVGGPTTLVVTLNPGTSTEQVLVEDYDFTLVDSKRFQVAAVIKFASDLPLTSDLYTRFGRVDVAITADWGFPTGGEGLALAAAATAETIRVWTQRDAAALALAPRQQGDLPAPPRPGPIPPEARILIKDLYRQRAF